MMYFLIGEKMLFTLFFSDKREKTPRLANSKKVNLLNLDKTRVKNPV